MLLRCDARSSPSPMSRHESAPGGSSAASALLARSMLSGGGKNSLSGGVASPRMGAAHDGLPKSGVMKAGEFW